MHRVSFFADTLPDRECEERDGMIDNKWVGLKKKEQNAKSRNWKDFTDE